MPLTLEQEEKLSFYISEIETNLKVLNDWEKTFYQDQAKRYDEHGSKINISPKQWAVLEKIYAKATE